MPNLRVMVFGIGAFSQAVMRVLKEHGAEVSCYLTRTFGHFGPMLEGPTYLSSEYPNPVQLVKDKKIDLIVPMSIDWAIKPWTQELLATGVPIFAPKNNAMNLERERDLGRKLCEQHDIPFPKSHFAKDQKEAELILKQDPRAYVIKNPLCSPSSPIHTIVCESVEDTKQWLPRLDYAEGVFLQEYVGRAEVGHIAVVSDGKIHSLVTNQEYKRAFNGNMGIVAGAPLGGLGEKDPNDKYGLAKQLLHPLMPWFHETKFNGPVQVTAAKYKGRWNVIEYNVRLGVTSTQIILRLLKNPLEVMCSTAKNSEVVAQFRDDLEFGVSVTLAGYGYPFIKIEGPKLPVRAPKDPTCDIWWNEVEQHEELGMVMTGHRIADVVAVTDSLQNSMTRVYENISNISCLSSYYRTDVGLSLWPPGEV